MRQLVFDLYYESLREINKIQKGKLLLSERIALEKALVKLEDLKKVLNICEVVNIKQ